jgi:hypothetical protein
MLIMKSDAASHSTSPLVDPLRRISVKDVKLYPMDAAKRIEVKAESVSVSERLAHGKSEHILLGRSFALTAMPSVAWWWSQEKIAR